MIPGFVTSAYRSNRASILVLMLLLWCAGCTRSAPPGVDISGDWDGTLQAGYVSLHLVLHVTSDDAGKLNVTLDSLDQDAIGLPGSDAALKGNSFGFGIPSVSGSYIGTVSADGSSITGTWSQRTSLPLNFTREHPAAVAHKPAELVGDWYATPLIMGDPQRLALHIKADSAGKLSLTFDNIDEKNFGLPASDVTLKDARFSFELPGVYARFNGTLSDDSKRITGIWNEDFPLQLVYNRYIGGPTPTAVSTPAPAPAKPPVALDDLKPVLDREMAPVLDHGLLSKASAGGGVVIGVLQHGRRKVFAYGAAQPDSIFEIGSITKTFTGLILAQMVVQKRVTLDEPIRALLPQGVVAKPAGAEITLVDLATQHSGLPRMPDNFKPKDLDNPYVDYDAAHLQEFIGRLGVAKPEKTYFHYSNLGFGLLGFGLSLRAGVPYPQLLSDEILGPLHMGDTAIALSPALRMRFIQGFDGQFNPAGAWDFDAMAGAGAIRSTADDMLTYLEANLHPEKYAAGAAAGSPRATLADAMKLDHQARADRSPSGLKKIALAWWFDPAKGIYSHGGATAGYTAMAGFNPAQDLAVVTLYNRDNQAIDAPRFAERLNQNIFEVMTGKPAIQIDYLSPAENRLLNPPVFGNDSIKGTYNCALTAFSLPAAIKDPFKPTASGEIHTVADGHGKFTAGSWVHHIGDLTCKLSLVSGDYSVDPDGVGRERISWKLEAQQPQACFQFFPPARSWISSEPQLIVKDISGKNIYSTSINPFAVINVACERETS